MKITFEVVAVLRSEHSYDHGAACAWTRATTLLLNSGDLAVYRQYGRGIGYAPPLDLGVGDRVEAEICEPKYVVGGYPKMWEPGFYRTFSGALQVSAV